MRESLVAFVTNPLVGFACGGLALVLGWKMKASWANIILIVAWAILIISLCRIPILLKGALLPRFLWTGLFASVSGIAIYYTLWTPTISTKESLNQEISAASELNLVFPDDPRMTDARKELIHREFVLFRDYLIEIGFEPPSVIPPIQVPDLEMFSGGMISGSNPYAYSLHIGEKALDNPRALRSSYSGYVFHRLLNVGETSIKDEPNRWASAVFFSTYFLSSYSENGNVNSPTWNKVLWELREHLGKNFMDHAMFYAVQNFNSHRNPKDEFDVFFRERIERGLLVMDNPGTKWRAKLDEAIREHIVSDTTENSEDL